MAKHSPDRKLKLASNPSHLPIGAIAMARQAGMEGRLRALLDSDRRRGRVSAAGIAAGLLVMVAIIAPLAALRARAQSADDAKPTPQTKRAAYFGHVVAADGSPVAGAEVVIVEGPPGSVAIVHATHSAADGSFSFSDVTVNPDADMRRIICARADKLGIFAAVGEAGNDVPIRFPGQSSLQVKVMGPDGKPAVGLKLLPKSSWPGGPDTFSLNYPPAWARDLVQQTDADGVCTFLLPRESRTLFAIDDPRFAELPWESRARASAAETSEPVTIQLKPASSLSGKIIYGPTGQPAAGVRVLAIGSTGRGEGRGDTITNDRGEFLMARLTAGDYDVKLYWPRSEWTAVPLTRVHVTEGQDLKDQNLILVRGGIINGRVYRGDTGQGMKGLNITAHNPTRHQTDDFVQTDSDGRYSLRIPAGTDRVFVNSPPIEGYIGFREENGRDMTVVEGQTVTHDFKLTPGPGKPVTGKVIDAEGKPLAGIRVMAQSWTPPLVDGSTAETDSQGNFRFVAVAPATQLRAAHPPLEMSKEISVDGGETDVTLQLVARARINATGMVVDPNNAPIVDARIMLNTSSGLTGLGNPDVAATDAQGRFALNGLSPSVQYSITVTAAGYGATDAPITFKTGATQVDMGMIRLDPATAQIAGRVVDGQGRPVAKARVRLVGAHVGVLDTQTDDQGRFSFKVVQGASATIFVHDPGILSKSVHVYAGNVNIELHQQSAAPDQKPGP